MKLSLRIAVADTDPRVRGFYQDLLRILHHQIVCVARTGAELLEACAAERPDLVVTEYYLPDSDGIALAEHFQKDEAVPVILVSGAAPVSEESLLTCPSNVVGCLVKPLKCRDLQPALLLAACRFEEAQFLRREVAKLRHALDDRQLVEHAKSILMQRCSLGERAAHFHLRKLARDKKCRILHIARMLIEEKVGSALDYTTHRHIEDGSPS